jgi:hypothetical protein
MLTEDQNRLWETYKAAEGKSLRAEKVRALEEFLDALETSPPMDWHPWARSIAEDVIDRGVDFVIRQPLFERAVFPALLTGYQAQLPGCARWLAGLSEQLYRSPKCREQLAPDEVMETALLRAAIRHDPADHRSRRRLIEKIASQLQYTIHEVPSGVLYDLVNSASPEQCLELEQELDEFCDLAAQEGASRQYADLIDRCRLHFRSYRDYLLHKDRFGSYATYLKERKLVP